MADQLAAAYITITANDQELQPGLDNARGQFNGFVQDVVSMLAQIKAAMIGLSLIRFGSDIESGLEDTAMAMNTIIKNMEKTKALMAELKKFSDATPFTPGQINKSARQLIAFGTEVENIGDELKMLGDLAAGSGSQLSDIVLIFSQIRGEGKLLTQDYRQLATRGINLRKQLIQDLGIAENEFQKFMSSGKISFEAVQNAMRNMTSEGGDFAGAMENMSTTLSGRLSTLKGRWESIGATIGSKVNPAYKGLVELLIKLADLYLMLDAATGGAVSITVTLVTVVGSLALAYSVATAAIVKFNIVANLGAVAATALKVAMVALRVGVLALGAYLGTRFVLALMGANKAMRDLKKSTDEMSDMTDKMVKAGMKRNSSAIEDARMLSTTAEKVEFLENKLKRANTELSANEKALKKTRTAVKDAQTAYNSFSSFFGIDNSKDEQAAFDRRMKMTQMWRNNVDQLKQEIESLNRAQNKQVNDEIAAIQKRRSEEGMSEAQIKLVELAEMGATAQQLQYVKALLDGEAAAKKKKEALEELEQEHQKNQETIQQIIDSNLQQIATFGQGAVGVDIYRAKLAGATEEQLKHIRAQHAALNLRREQEKQFRERDQILEDNKTPAEKFLDKIKDLNEKVKAGFLKKEDAKKAAERFQAELDGTLSRDVDKKVNIQPEFLGLKDLNQRIQMSMFDDDQKKINKDQLKEQRKQALLQAAGNADIKKIAENFDKIGGV